MRKILGFVLIVFICACQGKPKTVKKEKASVDLANESSSEAAIFARKDTLSNYWPISNDTLRFRKKIMIDEKESVLFVKKFSLNDSSVINTGVGDKNIFIDFSHNNAVDLELFIDTINIQKRISKADFENDFDPNDLKMMNLMSIGVDSVSNNVFYLTSDLGIPDTDILWEIKYSFELSNKNFDSIRVEKID